MHNYSTYLALCILSDLVSLNSMNGYVANYISDFLLLLKYISIANIEMC